MFIKTVIVCLLALSRINGFAQEHDSSASASDDHVFKHHRVGIILGHGHVIGAETANGKNLVTIPTWGLDYSYWFNPKMGIGLKSDIEIMDYVIVDNEGNTLIRENPIIVSILFLYHTRKGWNFLTGPGIEFEENHNFFIYRIGASYEFELPNHWDFAPEALFDVKDGSIGSFTWGIGVGKRF